MTVTCVTYGMFSPLTSLACMTMTDNINLTGTIPEEISAISTLQVFQLSGNAISGSLPTSLGSLSSLQVWDVERNLLTGPAFVPLPPSLASYRISSNQLVGPIPELSTLLELTELWASGNFITGTIPSSFSLLTNIGKWCGDAWK